MKKIKSEDIKIEKKTSIPTIYGGGCPEYNEPKHIKSFLNNTKEKPNLKLTCACGKCHETDNERISNIKSLDMYFKKGDKRRGEALVLCAEAFLLGKESAESHGKTKREVKNEY